MSAEEVWRFGPHRSLVGIYTPADPGAGAIAGHPACLLLNAGLVHHAGPGRLYVHLARALSRCGIATLRFDYSGLGDSPPRPDHLPATELLRREPLEAIDALGGRGHERVVPGGLCSGAAYALGVADDPRVGGLLLINPASASAEPAAASGASAQYYLHRSLRNPRAWLNLFTGRVKYRPLVATFSREIGRRLRGDKGGPRDVLDQVLADLQPARQRGLPTLLALSDRQADLRGLLGTRGTELDRLGWLTVHEQRDADHLYTSPRAQQLLIATICEWMSA